MCIISKDITLTVDGSPQSFRLTKPDAAVRGVPDPAVTESLVMNIAGQVLTFLGLIGGYRGSDHGGNGRQRESDWIPGTLG